jgi:hypothetical protein
MAQMRKTVADEGFVSPLEDPAATSKAIAAALASTADPVLEPPPDTVVTLPGGLAIGSTVIRTAEVRELTGEHEEIIAKATQSRNGNIFHFMNVLLECGTMRIGTEDPADTKKLLKNMLVGDRDALILGIRRATYGDSIELERWTCPGCGEASDLTVPLDDIPVQELEGSGTFTVELRKGRSAELRLTTGADQLTIFEDAKLSDAERNTLWLSRCIVSLTDADETKHTTAGFALGYARSLSIPDRHTILRELTDRQPGPRMSDMRITHEICGKEVDLLLGIADLFRDITMA